MKNSTPYIVSGVLAVALIILYILYFTSKSSVNGDAGKGLSVLLNDSSVTLPVAYVNVDSLLTNYNFAKDLNESLLRKEESTRATLNQRQSQINSAAQEFDRKLRNNAFLSQERAQQEQERIVQMNQEYQQLADRLSQEFMLEQQKLNLQMEDTIKARMKEFNADKHYEIIFSNRTTSTVLYADDKYDITSEVVEFLNSKYGPATATAAGKTGKK
ncbi:MAG: OmpH family outer membrane protein [Porphyromonadaceae bacterium]|nr:OmpH family outer membrane protein [Porphyromonadaceae bacterium]